MNINSVRKIAPGQMPRAAEWNAIVEHLQTAELRKSVLRPEVLPKTRFYTEEDIPAYSLFPVRYGFSDTDSLRACYTVEAFDASHASEYLPGMFATNGKYAVTAHSGFYGFIIDPVHDWVVTISDASDTSKECGFSENPSFFASSNGTGLHISGVAPFGENLYFVRASLDAPESDTVLCQIIGGNAESGFSAAFYANGKSVLATGSGTVFANELALGAKLTKGTWCIAHPCQTRAAGGNDDVD